MKNRTKKWITYIIATILVIIGNMLIAYYNYTRDNIYISLIGWAINGAVVGTLAGLIDFD